MIAARLLQHGLIFLSSVLVYVWGGCGGDFSELACSQWGTSAQNECIMNPGYAACVCELSCDSTAFCSSLTNDTDCYCRYYATRGELESDPVKAENCTTTYQLRNTVNCTDVPPTVIDHGTVEVATLKPYYRYMDRVRYFCDTGYKHTAYTRPSLVCNIDGTWHWGKQAHNGTCQLIDCGKPATNVTGATVDFGNTTYGNNVTYKCSDGTTATAICGMSETWEGAEGFTCAISGNEFSEEGRGGTKEAAGAVIFGVIGIVIMVSIISCIVLMDCTSCSKHMALGRRNTRPFRKWVRKRLREGCCKSSESQVSSIYLEELPKKENESDVQNAGAQKADAHTPGTSKSDTDQPSSQQQSTQKADPHGSESSPSDKQNTGGQKASAPIPLIPRAGGQKTGPKKPEKRQKGVFLNSYMQNSVVQKPGAKKTNIKRSWVLKPGTQKTDKASSKSDSMSEVNETNQFEPTSRKINKSFVKKQVRL